MPSRPGRTFISNSPLLTFTVNGHEAGATLALDSRKDRVVRIHASAQSQLPYDRLDIVANGEPVAEASPSGDRHRAEINLEYPVTRSCWIAARAYENLDRYHARGIDFSEVHPADGPLVSSIYGHRRPETVFAHSSPVYAVRDGQPIRSSADAGYFIKYIDTAIDWLRTKGRFASASDQRASIEAFEKGRAVYQKRAAGERR